MGAHDDTPEALIEDLWSAVEQVRILAEDKPDEVQPDAIVAAIAELRAVLVKSLGGTDRDIVEGWVLEDQYEYVRYHFGEERAAAANYGWSTVENPQGVSITTKVYGEGLLVSTGKVVIGHTFEEAN